MDVNLPAEFSGLTPLMCAALCKTGAYRVKLLPISKWAGPAYIKAKHHTMPYISFQMSALNSGLHPHLLV